MPNHYTLLALCGDTWGEDKPFDADAFNEEKPCLCAKVRPMPKELHDIIATQHPQREVNGERILLTDDELDALRTAYGATTWYDWCLTNWGTKWGTYDIKATVLTGDGAPVLISMTCAWGPPNAECLSEITEWLKETYGFDDVGWIGFNPADSTVEHIEVRKTVNQ